jgi:hypothetical protein
MCICARANITEKREREREREKALSSIIDKMYIKKKS